MSLSIQNITRFINVSQEMILIELKLENSGQTTCFLKSDDFHVVGKKACYFRLFVLPGSRILSLGLFSRNEIEENIQLFHTAMVFDADEKSLIAHKSSYDCDCREHMDNIRILPILQLLHPMHFPLTIICSIVIENADKETALIQNCNHRVMIPALDINKEIALDQCADKEVMSIQNTAKEVATETSSNNNIPLECLQELSVNFKKLLDQAVGTDITIHVEGASMKVHKNILRVRSPVFERMFDHDTSEAVKNEIDIKDIRAPIMRELVTFLYTGAIENHEFDNAFDLYYAADKYEVLSLRNACKEDLLRHLQVDNACQLLILASNHGDKSFKEKILEYIMTNLNEIVAAKSFEELAKYDPNLVVVLMRKHMQSLKSEK